MPEERSSHSAVMEPSLLLDAYRQGAFPMAMPGGEIGWFSPDPRAILPLDRFHIPHGLQRALRKQLFEIRINRDFAGVVRACADREETWINRTIFHSYLRLYHLGYAHSVEAWMEGRLVGGLYGVAVGGAFFGESMFHTVTDASKVALHALISRLKERHFSLLDIQWTTPHLSTFGAVEIPRAEYLERLARCIEDECNFLDKPLPLEPDFLAE